MKKLFKIIFINLLIFFILIIFIDLFSLVTLNVNQIFKEKKISNTDIIDFRSKYPLYNGYNWSNIFYKELYKLKLEYRSYYGWRAQYFKGSTINIDSAGIRKTIDYHSEIKKNKSISFFGGSTTWGFGVNDSLTIPSLFSKVSKGNFEVYNYGEQAFKAHQSLQLMLIEFSQKNPTDYVVYYDGANNYKEVNERLFSTNREKQIIERLKGMDTDLNGVNIDKPDAIKFSKHYFFPTMYLLNKFSLKFNFVNKKSIESYKIQTDMYSDSLAAIELLESWLLAKTFVEARGKKFICILQPTLYTSSSPVSTYLSEAVKHEIITKRAYEYYKNIKKYLNYNKYKGLMSNFVDLSEEFYNEDNVYIDFCHIGPKGNLDIAKKINKIINIK